MMGPADGPQEPAAEELGDARVGKILQGRYRILSRIASGGMGSVYRGERLGLGRPVAIKFLHATMARDPQVMKRFEREARAMSMLGHPNCIAVLDYGVDELPYLVMDLVQGAPLRDTIEVGKLAPRRAIKIARQLLAALGHAHAQGIVHRDIKPENVLLESAPGLHDHVRVLDFGLAKLMGSESGLTVGMAIGTPNYMAPEQTKEGSVDKRADLYAVGIVLHEMLTGQKPFDSSEVGEVFLKQMGMPMPRLRQVAPQAGFSAALEAVIQRVCEKEPDRRFPDAESMAAALELVPEANATPGPLPVAPPTPATDATIYSPKSNPLPPPAAAPLVDATIADPMTAKLAAVVVPTSALLVPSKLRGLTGHPLRLAGVAALASSLLVVLVAVLFLPRSRPPAPVPAPGSRPAAPATAAGQRAPASAPTAAPASPGTGPSAARAAAPVKRPAGFRAQDAARKDEAAVRARTLLEAGRWSEGMQAYRAAIRSDPARRGDKTLVQPLIASLDSDSKGERAAFLKELGAPARPLLREAARSHPNPKVRARAAELVKPVGPRRRPFLKWL